MSKGSAGTSHKNLRIEAARKKAKQKKLVSAILGTVIVVAVTAFLINSSIQQRRIETYTNGVKMVQLLEDGNFSATLAHNVRKTGTYTKEEEDGGITVTFNTRGTAESGRIIDNALHIPEEWDDEHNHGRILPRR
jgi:hypothetical protein